MRGLKRDKRSAWTTSGTTVCHGLSRLLRNIESEVAVNRRTDNYSARRGHVSCNYAANVASPRVQIVAPMPLDETYRKQRDNIIPIPRISQTESSISNSLGRNYRSVCYARRHCEALFRLIARHRRYWNGLTIPDRSGEEETIRDGRDCVLKYLIRIAGWILTLGYPVVLILQNPLTDTDVVDTRNKSSKSVSKRIYSRIDFSKIKFVKLKQDYRIW